MKEEIEEQENEEQEMQVKPANKKVTIINFIIVAVICIALIAYMIWKDGIDNIISLLHQVDYRWVIGGLICLFIHSVCEAFTLHLPLKTKYKDQPFTNSVKVSMIGLLFNNITPFASGGQPMQAYELTKTGKRVSDSLSVLAMKFIIVQSSLVITTIVIAAFQLDFFINLMKDYLWVTIIGFAINIIAIIGVILIGVKRSIIKKITTPFIKFFAKIHLIKHPEERIKKLNKSIDNFSEQFKIMKEEKKMVLETFIIASIQSIAYYSITYMVYRAFGNSGIGFWQIIPIQAFLLLIMMFIPTPGSGLGAEGGFLLLFNSIFKEGTINLSILFWRIYTCYLPIIIGLLFMIPTKGKITKRTVKENTELQK